MILRANFLVAVCSLVVFLAVTSTLASKPTTGNPLYTQTAVSIPGVGVGSCSGTGTGCNSVMGMDWLSNGLMVLLTCDYEAGGAIPSAPRPLSKVTLVAGLPDGPLNAITLASNFKMPTGVVVVNDRIYVADKDSFYSVPSNTPPADPTTNRQRRFVAPNPNSTPTNPLNFTWQDGPYWHRWIFTPNYYQGKFYANYEGDLQNGGPSNLNPNSFFSGALLAFDTNATVLDTNLNRASGGFRSPNGNNIGPGGVIMSADNQGSWLPMCYLVLVKPFTNQYFGHRQGNGYTKSWGQAWFDAKRLQYDPPVAIMDYAANGWRSLGQPLYLPAGPYAGDWLVGDDNATGIERVAVDSVADTTGAPKIQCAVFYFANSTGNDAINRLSFGPDGSIYAGTHRQIGNWPSNVAAQVMYKYTPNNASQFEIRKIRSLADGFELYLSRPVNPATVVTSNFTVQQKSWIRLTAYGAGSGSYVNRTVSSATVSNDSLRIHLVVPGILRINQQGRTDTAGSPFTHYVTHFQFNNLTGTGAGTANTNFTNEAWYAQNWISARTWDAAAPTPTHIAKFSPLDGHVWYSVSPGMLRVNVDVIKPYRASVRDLQGRVILEKKGFGVGHVDFAAPSRIQSLYVVEVRSGSNSFSKIVTF